MDWSKIKSEYITDDSSSYRKLADKYGVPLGTLYKRAKKENWVSLKKQSGDRKVAKSVAVIESKQAEKFKRISDITDKLLDKLEKAVDELDIHLATKTTKVKEIEYNNDYRPDKPTKETVTETEEITEYRAIVDRTGLKAIASALRDLKEVQMIKSELDEREQEARIKNLQRQAEKDEDAVNEVAVTFTAGPEEWNE